MKLSTEGKLRLAAKVMFLAGVGATAKMAYADAPQTVSTVQAQSASAATAQTKAGSKTDAKTDLTATTVAVADTSATGATSSATMVAQAGTAAPTTAAGSSTAPATVNLGAVQVTGTRIKAKNLTSYSPVTTVDSKEFTFEGAVRAEDLLNNLPQVFADQGGNLSNGATGTATVNLRNLGAERTLVLINGRRLVPGDPSDPVSDLNFIPAGLIDHVDVLTGGASAVYGADAVAGVVNFGMKQDFEGVRVDVQRSADWHDNGNSNIEHDVTHAGFDIPPSSNFDGFGDNVTLMMGTNSSDGKGNITAYATYLHLNPVFQSNRDYSACTLEEHNNGFQCGGSATNAVGTILAFSDPNIGPSELAINPSNQTIGNFTGANLFNYGALNYLQRNDERYTMGAFGHYDINQYAQAYTELMFMDDHTDAVIAPSGEFANSQIQVACDGSNPLISAQQESKLCVNQTTGSVPIYLLRRDVEGGDRTDDLRHTDYRYVLGLKGRIAGDWAYDGYVQQGTSVYSEQYLNEFSQRKFINATNVVAGPGGTPECESVANGSDLSCVPYNFWTAGGVTPAALAYVSADGFKEGLTTEQVADVSANGSIPLRIPSAQAPLAAAVGVEYRREALSLSVDQEFESGDLTGQGGATKPDNGSYADKEVFGELRLPIVQNHFLAKDLSASAGYRYSDYDDTHATNTYALGLNWAASSDFATRASYNRAVRVPTVVDLFTPDSVGIDGATDPCAGPTPVAGCKNDPYFQANPGQLGNVAPNPAGQYNGLTGGNRNLDPETAFTYTAGFVVTPTAVKGLSVTVDYYNIKVKNAIGGIGADNILNDCYTNDKNCDLIHRAPNSGSLWAGTNGYVIDTNVNTGFEQVKGIDVAANYRMPLSRVGLSRHAGELDVDFVGTRDLKENHQPDSGDPSYTYSCEGAYGLNCGTPVPTWRQKMRFTYGNAFWHDGWLGHPEASLDWRYIASVKADDLSTGVNAADQKLSSANYFDLFGSIKIHKSYEFRLGINNILDRDPPIVGTGGASAVYASGNTYPQVYDALGRYLFMGVTADF